MKAFISDSSFFVIVQLSHPYMYVATSHTRTISNRIFAPMEIPWLLLSCFKPSAMPYCIGQQA